MESFNMVKIYCLKDPRTNLIRYVGKTKTSIYDRLKVHMYQSKKSKKPTHKESWIKQLLKLKLKPTIEILEEVSELEWIEKEKHWIKQYDNLTNLSEGGDGHFGVKHTEEWKRKNSERMKGNKNGVGHKWTEERREHMKTLKKANRPRKGFKASDEFRKNMSKRMTGERHPQAKLSNIEVIEIREKFRNGETGKELAKLYKITYSHIIKIVNNKIRKICVL